MQGKNEEAGFIKFLGTAGARFATLKQLRASAGIWVNYKQTNILIDPGPGSLVKILSSRPKLSPESLNALVLTHKHIDHSSDINILIEAMTQSGRKKEGLLIAPQDAFGKDGVIFSYLEDFVKKTEIARVGKTFQIKDIHLAIASKMLHTVETYGLKLSAAGKTISFISDTLYFSDLENIYKNTDILVINVVLKEKKPQVYHLCLEEAKHLIMAIKPKKAVLTHFGMTMLKAKPHILARTISRELSIETTAAYDGMNLKI